MPLTDLSWQLYLLLFSVVVMLPCIAVFLLCRIYKKALQPSLWSLVGFGSLFLWLSWSLSHNAIVLEGSQLTLKAGFYQASFKDLSRAGTGIEVLGRAELGDFAPSVAVNALQLPSYQVGWFRLKNQQLAFVMLIGDSQEVSLVRAGNQLALVGGNLLSSSGTVVAAR